MKPQRDGAADAHAAHNREELGSTPLTATGGTSESHLPTDEAATISQRSSLRIPDTTGSNRHGLGVADPPGDAAEVRGPNSNAEISPGTRATFTNHVNGLIYTVVTRDGDDCSVQDPRGRVLRNVPVEHLAPLSSRSETPKRCWREPDELEVF